MIEAKKDLRKGKIMKISGMAWAGLAAAVIAATPALAAEDSKALIPGDFSANVGVFSDYTFRGISQTGDEPAAQGGIDYSLDTGVNGVGLYLGVWGSNVDFSDGDEASVEIDWYGGLSKNFGGLDASIGRQLIEDNAAFGTPDYWDWRIGASLALTPNISVSAFYTDTDISSAECSSENCDARGQVSLTASF